MRESAQVGALALSTVTRRERAELAVRRLAGITVAGAAIGVLVGGVGGRLAMLLLARLNPQVTGTLSDDGFVMGHFDLINTLNLLSVGLLLGLLGAALYAVLRNLMIGPRWFRVASISIGPAVVVGDTLVNTDGVDFRLLAPAWLAITLFVLIPATYAGLLTVTAERLIRQGSWFLRGRFTLVASVLLLYVIAFPLIPILIALAVLWLIGDALRSTTFGARAFAWPIGPWLARMALGIIFIIAGASLIRDIQILV